MTPTELGRILSEMYRDAPKGEATTMIHLFGIRYVDEIWNCGAPFVSPRSPAASLW